MINDTQALIEAINPMRSNKVANYVIAGLDSYLLENGRVIRVNVKG